jgi:predicted transcriptional regulator
MINEPRSEFLPQVRCTPTLKRRLERIAADSVSTDLSDHIRYAVTQYVERTEAASPVKELQPE